METPEVSEFRRCILEADWSNAHAALVRLGATEEDELWVIMVLTQSLVLC